MTFQGLGLSDLRARLGRAYVFPETSLTGHRIGRVAKCRSSWLYIPGGWGHDRSFIRSSYYFYTSIIPDNNALCNRIYFILARAYLITNGKDLRNRIYICRGASIRGCGIIFERRNISWRVEKPAMESGRKPPDRMAFRPHHTPLVYFEY